MLTPTKLFFIRLKQHARFITKSFNSVLDWSVWVYFVVPLIVVGIGLYVDLWRRFPDWANFISWEWIMIALVSIFAMGTKPYVGVAEADQLLLLQHQVWFKVMKQWGLGYNFIMTIVRISLLICLLSPFLVQANGFTFMDIVLFFIYSIGVVMTMLMLSPILHKKGRWWQRTIFFTIQITVITLIWILPAYGLCFKQWDFSLLLFGLLVVVIVSLWRYIARPLPFNQQLQQELDFRMSITSILLSQVQEKRPSKRRKKPWIFRSSQKLFKNSNLVYTVSELRIKALLRSTNILRVGLTIIVSGSYAIILTGGTGAIAVAVGLVFLKRVWLNMQWGQWINEQYIQLYLTDSQITKEAKKLSTNILTVPGIIIWLVVLGFTL